MGDRTKQKKTKLETVEPLGKRVLIRKDEDKKVTKGGRTRKPKKTSNRRILRRRKSRRYGQVSLKKRR